MEKKGVNKQTKLTGRNVISIAYCRLQTVTQTKSSRFFSRGMGWQISSPAFGTSPVSEGMRGHWSTDCSEQQMSTASPLRHSPPLPFPTRQTEAKRILLDPTNSTFSYGRRGLRICEQDRAMEHFARTARTPSLKEIMR